LVQQKLVVIKIIGVFVVDSNETFPITVLLKTKLPLLDLNQMS
jgi:hypothetical protein